MYREMLLSGRQSIGVWGTGYIGMSTMAYFAREGVKCIGLDVVPAVVEAINRGQPPIKELKDWLGFSIRPLVEQGLIRATTDKSDLLREDVRVHFIAIPTEKDGEPYFDVLDIVLGHLLSLKDLKLTPPPFIIVESTLTPRTTDRRIIPRFERAGLEVGKDVRLGIAPRRDWFVEGGGSLKELDRVFGSTDEESTRELGEILGIVCERLHAARNHACAEMVKSVENSYRHMEITLANQLSLAFPDDDMREVLRLVGTKWNVGTYHPGFGTGGYCIPLSSRYVLQGAARPEELSLLKDTIETDTKINRLIARSLIARGADKVGVLGLSYKADLKVHILSPALPFIEELRSNGATVKLYDPHFSADEVEKICGVPCFDYPEGLEEFDTVVLTVDHKSFKETQHEAAKHLEKCRFVLDNHGVWRELALATDRREYKVAGEAGWLGD